MGHAVSEVYLARRMVIGGSGYMIGHGGRMRPKELLHCLLLRALLLAGLPFPAMPCLAIARLAAYLPAYTVLPCLVLSCLALPCFRRSFRFRILFDHSLVSESTS